jgi:hypothetical protein
LDLDLSDFVVAHCRLDDPGFGPLLAQENAEAGGLALRHMHVELEHLTNIAIKDLGNELSYID